MSKTNETKGNKAKGTKANVKPKSNRARLGAIVLVVTRNPIVALTYKGVRIDNPLNATKQGALRALVNELGAKAVEPEGQRMLKRAFARLGGLHKAGSTDTLLGNANAEYSGYVRHELDGKHNPKPESVAMCADFAKHYMGGLGTCVLADGSEVPTKAERDDTARKA